MRRSDDDHISGHHGRRMKPDFAGDRIDLLIVVELQIDDAVLAEAGTGMPVLAFSAMSRYPGVT